MLGMRQERPPGLEQSPVWHSGGSAGNTEYYDMATEDYEGIGPAKPMPQRPSHQVTTRNTFIEVNDTDDGTSSVGAASAPELSPAAQAKPAVEAGCKYKHKKCKPAVREPAAARVAADLAAAAEVARRAADAAAAEEVARAAAEQAGATEAAATRHAEAQAKATADAENEAEARAEAKEKAAAETASKQNAEAVAKAEAQARAKTAAKASDAEAEALAAAGVAAQPTVVSAEFMAALLAGDEQAQAFATFLREQHLDA